jgi:hypothetical protein
MPNWCTNSIVIYAKVKTLRKIFADPDETRDPYEALIHFDLATLYRLYQLDEGKVKSDYEWVNLPDDWQMQFSNVEYHFDKGEDTRVEYTFGYNSAWDPPKSELKSLVQRYKCAVSCRYDEPNMELRGLFGCHYDAENQRVHIDTDSQYPIRVNYDRLRFPG